MRAPPNQKRRNQKTTERSRGESPRSFKNLRIFLPATIGVDHFHRRITRRFFLRVACVKLKTPPEGGVGPVVSTQLARAGHWTVALGKISARFACGRYILSS